MSVRPALQSDADAVERLAADFVAYLTELGDAAPRGLTAEEYVRDGFGARPAFCGLVAEDVTGVVGYLLYHEGYDIDRGGRVLHVVDLFVSTRARRRGFGRALMEAAREAGRCSNANALLWTVYPPNVAAVAFYERLGAALAPDRLMSWPASSDCL